MIFQILTEYFFRKWNYVINTLLKQKVYSLCRSNQNVIHVWDSHINKTKLTGQTTFRCGSISQMINIKVFHRFFFCEHLLLLYWYAKHTMPLHVQTCNWTWNRTKNLKERWRFILFKENFRHGEIGNCKI